MRLPILLALAVIVLTPADIREIVYGVAGDARLAITKILAQPPVQVAEADQPAVLSRMIDTSR